LLFETSDAANFFERGFVVLSRRGEKVDQQLHQLIHSFLIFVSMCERPHRPRQVLLIFRQSLIQPFQFATLFPLRVRLRLRLNCLGGALRPRERKQ
jgi:hypothetical protein